MDLFEELMKNQKYWIRFELGLYELEGKNYFKEVYYRAKSIFNDLFDENDDILLVVSVNYHIDDKGNNLPRIKRFLRNDKLIQGLIRKGKPFEYDEEDTDMKTTRYSLKVKREDLYLDYIIETLGNKQSHRKPRINANLSIVNLTRKTLSIYRKKTPTSIT